MKKLLISTMIAALAFCAPVNADGIQDGLADPVVTPLPIPSPIGGLYVGVMATKTETGTTTETSSTDCVYPEKSPQALTRTRIVPCEDVTTTTLESLLDEDTGASGFVGYNVMIGSFVFGPELGSDGDMTTLDVKAGLALTSNLIAYGFAGGAQIGGDDGGTYGVAVDYISNDGFLIGARGMKSDDLDVTQIGLRLGYSF